MMRHENRKHIENTIKCADVEKLYSYNNYVKAS